MIYVLLMRTDYEGDDLLGLYKTREDAFAAAREFIDRYHGHPDRLIVSSCEVGEPACYVSSDGEEIFVWRHSGDPWQV